MGIEVIDRFKRRVNLGREGLGYLSIKSLFSYLFSGFIKNNIY